MRGLRCMISASEAKTSTALQTMTYSARITATEMGFFALVVRVDQDGREQVDPCYRGRHFATLANAERSTAKYLKAA